MHPKKNKKYSQYLRTRVYTIYPNIWLPDVDIYIREYRDNRWNNRMLYWRTWKYKRGRGIPQMIQTDDLKKHSGEKLMQITTEDNGKDMSGNLYLRQLG